MRARWRSDGAARRLRVVAFAAAVCATTAVPAAAASLRYCDRAVEPSATQQDRLLRFAARIRLELERAGVQAAIVSRSGLDLSLIDVRYSHAGVALRDSAHLPWSVRQLYYACDEARPRIFDQGLAGFAFGTHDAALGYVSLLLLPADADAALARAARDDALALALLGARYSANAYAYAEVYQNCNQWLAELLASAFDDGGDAASAAPPATRRAAAQRWLQRAGYAPSAFAIGAFGMLVASFVPWLHRDDHPSDALANATFAVSMPASIEAFVRERWPGSQRLELCHDGERIVVRRGWQPIAAGCVAAAGDEVVAF